MRNEFREIEKTLQLINEQRKAAEEKLKYIVNMAIVDASKDYPVKRLGPNIISVRFSDLIGNPWNQQYYDMVGIFERYKNIADGDMEVAMNFIKEAYPFNEETEVFIRKKFNMSIPVEPEE